MKLQNLYCPEFTHCCSGKPSSDGSYKESAEMMKMFNASLSAQNGNKQATGGNQYQPLNSQFNNTEVNNMPVEGYNSSTAVQGAIDDMKAQFEGESLEEMKNGMDNAMNEMKKENAKTALMAMIKGAKISF